MTGSLQIKKGKYYMTINTYVDGKRKVKWISTGIPAIKGNKRKAEDLLRETLVKFDSDSSSMDPRNFKAHNLMFSDLMNLWLEHTKLSVDKVSLINYSAAVKNHINPYFDERNLKLIDVDRNVIQMFLDYKLNDTTLDNSKVLSTKSVHHLKGVITSACYYGVLIDLLPSSPCHHLKMPKLNLSAGQTYSESQLNDLLKTAKDHWLYPIIKFSVVYGLRRSEVIGLKWSAIDFDAKSFTICHVVVPGSGPKDKTKNKSSHRTYPLLSDIENLLLSIKHKQDKNRILFGSSYIDSDYVFTRPNGFLINPAGISSSFNRFLKDNNLPLIRFHDLRHSCASYLLNNGYSLKDVQEWMGHSNISTTANIYGHLDIARKYNIAEKMTSTFVNQ